MRNATTITLALMTLLAVAAGGAIAAEQATESQTVESSEFENESQMVENVFEIEYTEPDVSETSVTLTDGDFEERDLDDETVELWEIDTSTDESAVLEATLDDTNVNDTFDADEQEPSLQNDAGPTATYDVDGSLEVDEASLYGPHSLAAGETLSIDVTWDATDSDLCLGIVNEDGEYTCLEQSDGQGSVTYEVQESGDYSALIANEGPHPVEYTGHYRV